MKPNVAGAGALAGPKQSYSGWSYWTSKAFRRDLENRVKRGPTQEEAQRAKAPKKGA